MDIQASASAGFDASHVNFGYLPCARKHGHYWTVTATVQGELDPVTGWPRGTAELREAVRALAKELDGRDLPEMLVGAVMSPVGIATVLSERLALQFPSLREVKVHCSDGTEGVVLRTPR